MSPVPPERPAAVHDLLGQALALLDESDQSLAAGYVSMALDLVKNRAASPPIIFAPLRDRR